MRRQKPGFTLVELLVVIAIIGILIALLLPAVQAAREAARRMQCKNHLKQMGLALLTTEESISQYPSGGWGWQWIGEPERGSDISQPGGWAFNILPFLEESNVRDLGNGLDTADRLRAIKIRARTPISTYYCPSRRPALPTPGWAGSTYRTGDPLQTITNTDLKLSSKTDYAANAGDTVSWDVSTGPQTLPEGDDPSFWIDGDNVRTDHLRNNTLGAVIRANTGAFFLHAIIKPKNVTDGVSHTYALGEKYLSPDQYLNGGATNEDDENVFCGFDDDSVRWTWPPQSDACPDCDGNSSPRQDRRGLTGLMTWGSAHTSGFHAVFLDGSVHVINYTIDPEVHRRLGNRKDGLPVEIGAL